MAHFRSTCGADRTAAAPHLIAVGGVGIDPGFEYQQFLIASEIGAGKSHPIYGMLHTWSIVENQQSLPILVELISRFGGDHSLIFPSMPATPTGRPSWNLGPNMLPKQPSGMLKASVCYALKPPGRVPRSSILFVGCV